MANKNSITSNLEISHWNANWLMHEWTELKRFINHNNIDVMLVNGIRTPQKYSYTLRAKSLASISFKVTADKTPIVTPTLNIDQDQQINENQIDDRDLSLMNYMIIYVITEPQSSNDPNELAVATARNVDQMVANYSTALTAIDGLG